MYSLVFGAALLAGGSACAYPSVFPTGTTVYQPDKAYNCYVLFGAPDGKTHLIDMDGNEIHSWSRIGFPSEMIDPAIAGGKKGHVLVQLENGQSPYGNIFANRKVGEFDWDGNTVWQWGAEAPGGVARQNHDWDRLANGNTLIITTIEHVIPGVSGKPVADQTIREITPAGKIVWEWTAGDHVDEFGITPEGRDLMRKVYANGGGHGMGFLTLNDMQPLGPNKWFDGGDTRFDPENIMIDSREASFVAIIEKRTGKIVWRMGPDYGRTEQVTTGTATVASADLRPVLGTAVPRPIDQTSGQHDAHLIAKGLPGAGNLLLFDNEGMSGFPPSKIGTLQGSRILEIDPIKQEIVWQYTSESSELPIWDFFSSFISSARRLPNGNTLIDEGVNGRLFQVTPKGQVVWEYVNPYFGRQTTGSATDKNLKEITTNWVYRAQPIPYDWVPGGTPHSEAGIDPVDVASFHIPQKPQK
jgi:hypothetical protein